MTGDFMVGMVLGALAGGCLGALGMAILTVASAADDLSIRLTEDTPQDDTQQDELHQQLAALRHQLETCQATAESQRQRADNYYDLFREGARANAALRKRG